MKEYYEYYGCYAVYQNREIAGIYDLEEPIDISGITPDIQTLVKCGNCDCWMVHRKTSSKCPKCAAVVSDEKVLDAIAEENERELKSWEEDYDDLY